jgi:prevent-host-death family protein
MINIHAAKTRLSQLVARAEKGERIVLARNGKPVAQLGPAPAVKRRRIPLDDPLLNLDSFGFDGPGGKLTNKQIDRIVYGT